MVKKRVSTYAEVCIDEGQDEALNVLYEVPKDCEPFWVGACLHFGVGAEFRS